MFFYIVRQLSATTFKFGISKGNSPSRLESYRTAFVQFDIHTLICENAMEVEKSVASELRKRGCLVRHDTGRFSEVAYCGPGDENMLRAISTAYNVRRISTPECSETLTPEVPNRIGRPSKPISCPFCGEKFPNKSAKANHKRRGKCSFSVENDVLGEFLGEYYEETGEYRDYVKLSEVWETLRDDRTYFDRMETKHNKQLSQRLKTKGVTMKTVGGASVLRCFKAKTGISTSDRQSHSPILSETDLAKEWTRDDDEAEVGLGDWLVGGDANSFVTSKQVIQEAEARGLVISSTKLGKMVKDEFGISSHMKHIPGKGKVRGYTGLRMKLTIEAARTSTSIV